MPLRAAIIALFLAAACAAKEETTLVVGPGWAFACQRMSVEFTNTTQDVPVAFVPPETDPASFDILPVSSPVDLLAWRRADGGHLVATLATDLPRPRDFDVAYLVRGPDWRASYQLVVRTDPDREDAPVSMDVEGRVTVQNAGGGSWTNATLRLVGTDVRPRPPAREPGFLDIDETSPLADLWRDAPAQEHTTFAYDFDRPVNLNAGEERSFTFVSATRCPAERRFIMKSTDIPADTIEPGRPLRHSIILRNDAEHGLGRDLPAGVAQIFVGSVRATLGESAWLDRTPAGGEIRIELGPSSHVRGLRRSLARTPGTPGQITEDFEVEIRNGLDSAAHVEVEEQPPARQDWTLLRTSAACEIRGRRLCYRLEVPAHDRLVIRYTIRTPAPMQ